MGILALVLAILGGLCGVMGVITCFDILEDPVITKLGSGEFMFWFMVAGLLLLGGIASLLTNRGSMED